jgi:hypothetical protein
MTETFKKDPYETGGILLGHILDNGIWIVMEVLPPGWRSVFQYAYFEYDKEFVNYVAQNESKKYEQELQLLGLWHRHPGSMDTFSGTDDGTNRTFAGLHPNGAISGLVNIDPRFRLTIYHVSNPLRYNKVAIEVGNDLIPEEYFKWKYYNEEGGLNPYPPQKKNGTTNTGTQFEIESGDRQTTSKDSNVITEFKSSFRSKYLFLLLFIVGTAFVLVSYYSYSKLKATDDVKLLYRLYYTEYTPKAPSADSIAFKASAAFDKNPPKVVLSRDSTYSNNLQKTINAFLEKNAIAITFRVKDANETPAKYNEEKEKHLVKVKPIKDSITLAYDSLLIKAELVKVKEDFINEKVKNFLDSFKKSHELTPDVAKKGIKTVVVFLFLASLLSLLLAFLPRKHKPFGEWVVIGVSAVIAALFAKLIYPLSPTFLVMLFFVFALLCFFAFVALFIFKSFKFKNRTKVKYSKTGFWFQNNPKLFMEEEAEIRVRFADAEKNVENGIVSFFINTNKKIAVEQDDLSFQLVYSADYLINKEIRIYLVFPDLDKLLGDKIKDFPCIAIDGAGESYLDLSKTLSKDKVSGLAVIRKFDEWFQQYIDWKANRINLKDIKL